MTDLAACSVCHHSADVHTPAGCVWQGCPCTADEVDEVQP